MEKGILYGVGVGPGDPELLTLKAVKRIENCKVIATPRTRTGRMVALEIVEQAMDLKGKEILSLDFTMSHDKAKREASHQKGAECIREYLDKGISVAMLNLGDVSIFASFQYISDILKPMGYPVEMVPGIPSFCAVAAALNTSLTEIGKPVHIIPGGADMQEELVGKPGTKIWMKSGKALPELLGTLEEKNALSGAMMVQNCGMEDEKIYQTIPESGIQDDYFSIVLLKE